LLSVDGFRLKGMQGPVTGKHLSVEHQNGTLHAKEAVRFVIKALAVWTRCTVCAVLNDNRVAVLQKAVYNLTATHLSIGKVWNREGGLRVVYFVQEVVELCVGCDRWDGSVVRGTGWSI
jgi:hypothetical protein